MMPGSGKIVDQALTCGALKPTPSDLRGPSARAGDQQFHVFPGRGGELIMLNRYSYKPLTCRALEPTTSDLGKPHFMIRMIMQGPIFSPTGPYSGPALTWANPTGPYQGPKPEHPGPCPWGPFRAPGRAGLTRPGAGRDKIKRKDAS